MDKPTRGKRTLDLVITNLAELYDKNSVNILPPFGLSDHNVVVLHPKARGTRGGPSRKLVSRRDTRESKRRELERYLCSIHWSAFDSGDCKSKAQLLEAFVRIGLDIIMPIKHSKDHVDDQPWITPEFKTLIKLRQEALMSGDNDRFNHYQNAVNRDRKTLRRKFFESRVSHLKKSKPNQWWSSVKKIAGMSPACGSEDVLTKLNSLYLDSLSPRELANKVNAAFTEPMKDFQPLVCPPSAKNTTSDVLQVSEFLVFNSLQQLNPNKSSGPDGVPNWLLRENADILARPVSFVLNSSFSE